MLRGFLLFPVCSIFGIDDAIIGGLILGGASIFGGSQANKTNERISDDQMRFQYNMSNTAYQRAVADMGKAGLNPMLAYQQGGASTPPGATTRVEDVISPAVSTAMQSMMVKEGINKTRAEVDQVQAATQAAKSQAMLNAQLAAKAAQDTRLQTVNADVQQATVLDAVERIRNEAGMSRAEFYRADEEAKHAETFYGARAQREKSSAAQVAQEVTQAAQAFVPEQRIREAGAELEESNLPAARAAKAKAETWWGRYVSPYLGDVARGASSAASLRPRR